MTKAEKEVLEIISSRLDKIEEFLSRSPKPQVLTAGYREEGKFPSYGRMRGSTSALLIPTSRLDDSESWVDYSGARLPIRTMSIGHVQKALNYLRNYYKHARWIEETPVVAAFKSRLHAEANRIDATARVRSDQLRAATDPR